MAQRLILQVEDNPGDVELLRQALVEIRSEVAVDAVRNGIHAFAYLNRAQVDERLPMPSMILLDLHMPLMGGLIFLRVLRAKEEWEHIPVTVLTSSLDRGDLLAAQGFGVARYEVKPTTYGGYIALARRLSSLPSVQARGAAAG
jgi:CheY-like chemotaxis protein